MSLFWPNVSTNYVRTRIKISKFVKSVLRSQYICLKVSINNRFDLFFTICTWCTYLSNLCTFLTEFEFNNVTTRKEVMGRHQNFVMFKNWPTWEMNFSPQMLYGYWFWYFYHCGYMMYKFRSFLTQFRVNDVMTGDSFRNF